MFVTIVATAVLSSLLTLLGVYLAVRYLLRRHLASMRSLLDRELEEIANTFEARVEQGVLKAAEEVLPEFRAEVREGFKEAIVSAVNGDVLTQTTQSVAKKSSRALWTLFFGDQDPD
ncbi:MAG: hypothetical protein KDC35_19075 [Acidobacteria bacterium]|nr:hypothetical protein [Acidobacteriota bacterium]